MAVVIISKSTNDRNGEIDEWISVAQSLLRDMASSSALAPKASQCLEIIQKLTREASFDPPPSTIGQYLERASQTMAQPQPSLVDLFDAQTMAEPLWGSELAAGYFMPFPSMELCCENVDQAPLQRFINERALACR